MVGYGYGKPSAAPGIEMGRSNDRHACGGAAMEQSVNEKLVEWIKKKVQTEYADDISLVVLYGSFINGTANSKSDIDCYFIPKTERGRQFANDFMICGVGYDIFPISWERAEHIADLKEVLLPLIGDANVIYHNSEEDIQRFLKLQTRLKNNLESRQITAAAAAEKINAGYQLYCQIQNSGDLSTIRKKAGYMIMTLADAAAVYHHTYYHYGLKRQFSDLTRIPDIPNEICDEYLNVIHADAPKDILAHCYGMLQAVCRNTKMQIPVMQADGMEEQEECLTQINYASLAALYEEISSTFNKIYVCCENGDYILAYLSAACLQEELDYAHRRLGAKHYDLIHRFDYRNLEKLSGDAQMIEKDFVDFITAGGGIIKKFESFEEFEQAMNGPLP